jgi:hypothetical protein
MAVDVGMKQPSNKEIVAGDPILNVLKVETATGVKNARLVKKGTTDADLVVCTDESKDYVGVVAREHTPPDYREDDRTTDYTAADFIGVVKKCVAVCYGAAAINKGDKVVPAASGAVKAAAPAVTATYDHAEVNTALDELQSIVGEAMESIGGAGFIMVELY